jgi:tRNA (guanine6-N2)-methyltransferase
VNRAKIQPAREGGESRRQRPLRLRRRLFIAQTQPGFESVAWSEIHARIPQAREFARRVVADRAGMTIFSSERTEPLRALRCSEDILALVGYSGDIGADAAALDRVRRTVREAPFMADALGARIVFDPTARAGRRLRFRVVARQAGEHDYRRVDLKRTVERAMEERGDHTWRLDEQDADVELWVTQLGAELMVAVRLSDERMRHRDYKVAHRPGSLRPAVAAAMAWLSEPRDDDIVLDPFCGTGTILIERAHLGRYAVLIGADRDPAAVRAALQNIGPRYKPIEIHGDWDAGAMPIGDGSVNKIVTNLPWGIRHGSHSENRRRYGDWMAEMKRVLAADGKMVVLSAEWRLMRDAIERAGLVAEAIMRVTILGVAASVYVCRKRDWPPKA